MSRYRTPLKRALGLGTARFGVRHFLVQRFTALALLVLGLWLVWMVLVLPMGDHAAVRGALARPGNALAMLLFVGALFWHVQLGLQVIIEDYVHRQLPHFVLQMLVGLVCIVGGAASALAVLRIALGH